MSAIGAMSIFEISPDADAKDNVITLTTKIKIILFTRRKRRFKFYAFLPVLDQLLIIQTFGNSKKITSTVADFVFAAIDIWRYEEC